MRIFLIYKKLMSCYKCIEKEKNTENKNQNFRQFTFKMYENDKEMQKDKLKKIKQI